MRTQTIQRKTKETDISVTMNLDGQGKVNISTPIPFFNHMIEAFAFYAKIDLDILAQGDVDVDDHHLVEDIGIVLGQVFNQALGSKKGIQRFASSLTPMDESLSRVVIDISNRPLLVFNATFTRPSIGGLSLENIKEFFYAFAIESRMTLHIDILYGDNNHHMVESIFKGFGRALREAIQITGTSIPSTKGVLE